MLTGAVPFDCAGVHVCGGKAHLLHLPLGEHLALIADPMLVTAVARHIDAGLGAAAAIEKARTDLVAFVPRRLIAALSKQLSLATIAPPIDPPY